MRELPGRREDDKREVDITQDRELVRLLDKAIAPLGIRHLPVGRILYLLYLQLHSAHFAGLGIQIRRSSNKNQHSLATGVGLTGAGWTALHPLAMKLLYCGGSERRLYAAQHKRLSPTSPLSRTSHAFRTRPNLQALRAWKKLHLAEGGGEECPVHQRRLMRGHSATGRGARQRGLWL